jgi:hypothetical protein
VEIRTEFPSLEERQAYLEHAAYVAATQNNDAISAGKPDGNVQAWQASIRRELDDINYVLKYFQLLRFRRESEWKQWQTVVVILIAIVAFGLSLFSIWRG